MPGEPAPRRNLPIQITAAGVTVSGIITTLNPNYIEVEITHPFRDLSSDLHVPHFAMYPVNWPRHGPQDDRNH